jgi:hypothetical protein
MKLKKANIIIMMFVLIAFATMAGPLLISENVSAHAPTAIYPTYKEGTLTIYIDHASDDPTIHYIKTVTVTVNRVEVLSETYTSQELGEKGMVTYSYSVAASDGDVISVTAECSIDGSITGSLIVGDDSKDDGKDDPSKDDPWKEYPDKNTSKKDPNQDDETNQENGNILLLSGAIVGVLVVIIALLAVLLDWKKRPSKNRSSKKNKIKNDDWATCPKCGSNIKMGQLTSHLDKVHTKLSMKAKEKIIDDVIKLH